LIIRDKVMRDLGIDERDERWGLGWVLRADMLRGMGRLDEAARVADRAVEEAQANRWKKAMPHALRGLALVALEMEDISSAGTLLRRARELFELAGEREAVANCAQWQGRVLLRRGNQATAERFFLEAAAICPEVQSPLGEATAMYWVGVVRRQQGKLEGSLEALQRAESLFAAGGDWVGEADCKLGRGLVWLYRGDLDASEILQEEALRLHQRLHHDEGSADCLNGLAEVARHRGDLESAEKNYRSAAAILSTTRASRAVLPQVNLALILIQRGEDDGARRLLESIAPPIERQGKRALLGAVHTLFLVLCAEDEGSVSWARHFRQASSLLQETGAVDPDIAWAAQISAERAVASGHLDRAEQAYTLAQDQWVRLQRVPEAERVAEALLKLKESLA
jgi:tetratricopeptide (TPR) repeat protein